MKIGQLYVLIAAFIWGVSAVVRKILVSNISPYSLVFLSTMLATFFLFITHNKIIRREINSLDKNKFKNYLSLAITGSIAAPLLFNYGIKLLDVSVVVVIERIQPVFTLILAYILLKERFPNQFYFLSFVCLFSSVILAAKSLDLSSIISVNYIGIFMIFGAALGWAILDGLWQQLLPKGC
jgi:drug/metabolite transporter (DMT)-like permease